MTDAALIAIEVVYATPARQQIVSLSVERTVTARDAALASGLDDFFPDIDLHHAPLGVFGKAVDDSQLLEAGDRVEIYRPLINEPREARRAAAARGDTLGNKSKGNEPKGSQ
jgi:putative ubiquitin-RnfH superfamily antitoxin RatB of RatAB toxin-antitoxin module